MDKANGPVVVRVMNAVDRVVVVIAQSLLAGMVLVTFVSVVGRTFFSSSVPDDLLMQEMLMVAIVFLPLSYVQSVGGHLEVTVLSDSLPRKIQALLTLLGLLLGVIAFGWMAYLAWVKAYDAYLSGVYAFSSVLYIPEWPAKMLIPIGLGWWCLRMAVQLVLPSARPVEAETELNQALEGSEYLTEGTVPRASDEARH